MNSFSSKIPIKQNGKGLNLNQCIKSFYIQQVSKLFKPNCEILLISQLLILSLTIESIALFLLKIQNTNYYHLFFENYEDSIMLFYLQLLVLLLIAFSQKNNKFAWLTDTIVTKVQYFNCFYLYLLQIPFQLSCLHKFKGYSSYDDNHQFLLHHLTVFSLIFSFSMGLCIEYHNQSLLSFDNKNFLQKNGQPSLHTVFYILKQILILISDTLVSDIITQVALILLCLNYCYFYFKNGEYINFQIQKLVIFSQFLLLYSSIIYLTLPQSFLQQKYLEFFIFFILFPFSIKSTLLYSSLKQNTIIDLIADNNICQSIGVHQLKYLIDFLLQEGDLFHLKYNNGKGVIFEDIKANHFILCKQEHFCFCHNYTQETYIKQQKQQDGQNRFNYLIEYIYQVIKIINSKNNLDKKHIASDNSNYRNDNSFNKRNTNSPYAIFFIQIYYAMQILKNPIKCMQLYYQLTKQIARDNKNNTTIFDLRVLFNIKQYISINFNEGLLKQYFANQFLNIYEVIVYEKRKNLIHQRLFDCIENTITYYNYLQSNQLSYILIENYSKNIIGKKKIIEEDFQFISEFVTQKEDTIFLAQIYLEAYDQENQTVQSFFQRLIRNDRLLNFQYEQKQQIQQFLSPNYGVIYSSLFNEGCKISQHSQSLITLLNLAYQNIVNLNVISFIPTEKQILEEVLNSSLNQTYRQQILSQRDRFGFGINEQSIIVPLSITTKMQFLSDEVGICILVKRCSIFNNFLLLSKYNKIVGATKSIQESIGQYQNYINIIGASIQDHIPYLKGFDYSSRKDILHSTIFFIDKQFKSTDTSNLFQSQTNFDQYLLFDISFKFISVQYDNHNTIQFNYLEIVNFKIIKDRDEIAIKIIQFKNQIDNPLLINNTDKDRDVIMSFIETKSLIFGTKFLPEPKMCLEAESFSDGKNDPVEEGNNDEKTQNENTSLQIQSQKKISYHYCSQQQNSIPQFMIQKSSNIQMVENCTEREKTQRYLNTQNQEANEFRLDELMFQSPRIADDQKKDDISTIRDLKSARQILEPTQSHTQYRLSDLRHKKRSSSDREISKSDFHNANDHKQIQYIFNNDQNSIKSKSSSNNNKSSSYKNRILKRIKQKRMSCNLKYFTMIGIVFLLQLLTVNLVFYQINLDGIASFQYYFKIISNPMIIYMKSLDILRLISYKKLITEDIFILKEQTTAEINKILIDQDGIQNTLKSQFVDLIEHSDSKLIDFVTHIELPATKFEYSLHKSRFLKNETSNLLITLKNYLTSSYLLHKDQDRKLYMWSNMIMLKQKVFTFQDYTKDDMIQRLEKCQNNNFITLVIIICSSLFLAIVILFIIYVQQMQKKKMLSFFGYFTPEILAAKCDKLQELIFQYKQNILQLKLNHFSNHTRERFVNYISSMDCVNKTKENYINKQESIKERKEGKNNLIVKKQNYRTQVAGNGDVYFDNVNNKINKQHIKNIDSEKKEEKNNANENQIINFNYNTDSNNLTRNQKSQNCNGLSQKKKQIKKSSKKSIQLIEEMQKNHSQIKRASQIKKGEDFCNFNRNEYITTNLNLNQKTCFRKEFANQNNKRKRIQAHFDKFRVLNYHHFIVSLIIICFLNCQSIVNIFILDDFENEQKWLIEEKLKIYDLGSIVIQNVSPQILNLEFYWQKGDPRSSIYTEFIEDQKEENQEKLLLVKTLADPVKFSLHNQQEYENFYAQMLTGDICQIREKFKSYVKTNYTLIQCQSLYEGILTKGFLLSISKAYQEVDSLINFYINRNVTDDDIQNSKRFYYKYQLNGHSLSELYNLIKIINESIDQIILYFHSSSDNYADFTVSLIHILFTLQIILVIILAVSIWFIINKKLNTEVNQIKTYFSLFNSRLLYSNSPLKQYFTKSYSE